MRSGPTILSYASSHKPSVKRFEGWRRIVIPMILFFLTMIASGLWIGHNIDRLNPPQILLLAFVAQIISSVIMVGTDRILVKWVSLPVATASAPKP